MRSSLDRRDFLRFGTVTLGAFGWPGLLRAIPPTLPSPTRGEGEKKPSPLVGEGRVGGRARSCILLYMDGGPSHIDLWDLKPDAPVEVRGPFRPIATSLPGVRVCEYLPHTARQMHRLTQIRSVRHTETVHDPAVYQMLTGRKHVSSAGNLTVQPSDFPQMGTAFGCMDRRPAVMPKVIELPETMRMEARILPGQNAGFLGATHDPFRVEVTREGFVVPPQFDPRGDVPPARLEQRATLLRQVNGRLAELDRQSQATGFDRFQQQALELLARPQIRRAFEMAREPAPIRERYGRNRHGQSVLLARRLVEAGARFVTVYWGKEMQDWADGRGARLANNPWDTHRNQFPLLKDQLLPRADRALAALMDDLHERGLLSSTLVVWMGDFGRTPRIDRKYASRDHWPHANTVLFAGGGVPAGLIHGRTDRQAAEVTENPVTPADLTATIFHLLGIDPHRLVHDTQGRPFALSEGTPLAALCPVASPRTP